MENELYAVIPAKTLSTILEKLENLEKLILQDSTKLSDNQWLNNQQAMEEIGVSKRTMQTYRDNGQIKFSQIGSKIYYRRKDLNQFLEKHSFPVHNKYK